MLVGRPLNSVDPGEGLYADEEGNPYQLLERGKTRPLPVKKAPVARNLSGRRKKQTAGRPTLWPSPGEGCRWYFNRRHCMGRAEGVTEETQKEKGTRAPATGRRATRSRAAAREI